MIFYGFYYGILVERIFLWFLWFFTCHICGNGFCSFLFQSLMVFMVFMIFMILNFLFISLDKISIAWRVLSIWHRTFRFPNKDQHPNMLKCFGSERNWGNLQPAFSHYFYFMLYIFSHSNLLETKGAQDNIYVYCIFLSFVS